MVSLKRLDELLTVIAAKKERLDAMSPVSRTALLALQKAYDVDLTYTRALPVGLHSSFQ